MIRAHRVAATAQDDASMIAGWNISPNIGYTLLLTPGASACAVLLFDAAMEKLIASGAALVGTAQPCDLVQNEGVVGMVDADLGWHLLITTVGTESRRTIRIGPAVDLPDEIHPIYGDDGLAVVRTTAGIDSAAHYIDDLTVSCPNGLGAGLGSVLSVPVDGAAIFGQTESITWTGTPNGAIDAAVIRRHVAIAPAPHVDPVPVTPPSVSDDAAETDAETATSGNVLANDEAGLTVVAVNGLTANVGASVSGSNGGVFAINEDGSWTVNPDGDFEALEGSETAETSVTYYVSDGVSEASATLTVTVSSGTAVLWTPAQIPGAIVFDALATDTITGTTAVSAWADMLGSGITAAQATGSLQPALVDGEMVFAGDYLTIASSGSAAWAKILHSTGGHIFALAKFGASDNPNAACALCGNSGTTQGSAGIGVWFDDRSSLSRNNGFPIAIYRAVAATQAATIVPLNVITPQQYALISMALDGDNATPGERIALSINESTPIKGNTSSNAASTANASYNMQIGAAGNNALPMIGAQKVLAFLPPISTDDAMRFAGWVAHRHGRTDLLPSGHPYKTTPPMM